MTGRPDLDTLARIQWRIVAAQCAVEGAHIDREEREALGLILLDARDEVAALRQRLEPASQETSDD